MADHTPWEFYGEPHSDLSDGEDSLRYQRELAAGVENPRPPRKLLIWADDEDEWAALGA